MESMPGLLLLLLGLLHFLLPPALPYLSCTQHTHTLAGLGVGGAPHFVCSAPCPLPPPPPNNNKPRRESRRIPTPFPHKGSTPWGRAGGQPTGARIAPTRSPPGGCGHGLCPPWTTFGWWEPSSPLTSTPIKKRDKMSLPQPSCPKTRSPQPAPSPRELHLYRSHTRREMHFKANASP